VAKKPSPTKTLNRLPFQDLEPHRFEDLVRNLLYDFKSWKSIEATGRSGSDEGFDVRAWELLSGVAGQDEEDEFGPHPMEGHLWKIQCKREKVIGPNKVRQIVQDGVSAANPPFGYILVAPTTFSKSSYDVFREELRRKGVMEFHLWGRAELEDMLLLPKHDSILFGFFGISLVTKKRQRSTEIRFSINSKNKLLKALGQTDFSSHFNSPVLLRDSKDSEYPSERNYADFREKPRWKEYAATEFHPRGLICRVKQHHAYINRRTRQYDFIKEVDLLFRRSDPLRASGTGETLQDRVRRYFRYLRKPQKGELTVTGIVAFEEVLVIDEKGDVAYDFPHIFVDFSPTTGPFSGFFAEIRVGNRPICLDDTYKQATILDRNFPLPAVGTWHRDRTLDLDENTKRELWTDYSLNSLFDVSGRYEFLGLRDVIEVKGLRPPFDTDRTFVEITSKYQIASREYLEDYPESGFTYQIQRQIGRELKDADVLTILEFEKLYEWELKEWE
jgi:hypothetical protein